MDTDKTRAMLAQLDGGVAEEERETSSEEKRYTVGPRSIAQHLQVAGAERYTQKSLGDAIFPMLEGALESEGLLHDISAEVADPAQWESGGLSRIAPPGSLVRITAMGSLFDSRYAASAFAAFASVTLGLHGMGIDLGATAKKVPPGKGKSGQGQRPPKAGHTQPEPQLEDAILDFQGPGGVDGDALRAIIRMARGIFAPGLHINLSPVESSNVLIGARLQQGRQYLDSEADILFARYGTEPQEWTLVGSVGSYGAKDTTLPEFDFFGAEGVKRGRFADGINGLMRYMGGMGFVDLPQYPGFSVIPFAVYRAIPRTAGQLAVHE
ncbi:hypothetical protein M4V62_20510 [Streptomyces durmitorensis]|uniref:Uncharacterized protein n=1 Tax=Streptomyces durmitorensis TaxID=319947 RepID=A0ABY4PVT6_9ACTN|nr:hypothetical protein [Streptomyces durmitorensis]UQT57289.1 hypothetical protein M4V62_20510 [Streptomyces durmitorensis]